VAYLVLEFEGKRREIPVRSPVTVGRQKECAVFLDDSRLSREHARVYFDGRVYVVQDLGSKNGTYLNGQLLHEQKMLRAGDRIRIGDATLTFALEPRDANLPPEARGLAEPPVSTAPSRAPEPPPALRGQRLDTERRERIVEHIQAVREAAAAGPCLAVRASLALLLVAIFGAAVFGFRLVFVWAFGRVFNT
jgi:pSer/pThr/pTyr-binding forkhead associated (FHA) protein